MDLCWDWEPTSISSQLREDEQLQKPVSTSICWCLGLSGTLTFISCPSSGVHQSGSWRTMYLACSVSMSKKEQDPPSVCQGHETMELVDRSSDPNFSSLFPRYSEQHIWWCWYSSQDYEWELNAQVLHSMFKKWGLLGISLPPPKTGRVPSSLLKKRSGPSILGDTSFLSCKKGLFCAFPQHCWY